MTTSPVIRFQKTLSDASRPAQQPLLPLRTFCPGDERHWLRLHSRCFVAPWAPAWDDDDFAREFLQRPWWAGERMAFAVTPSRGLPIGTITVGGPPGSHIHIAWLAVDPHYRRRQVGRCLLQWAECAIWDLGGRQVVAETLSSWHEAVAFYQAIGYVPDREWPSTNLP